jgi:hypothetical protein
MFLLYSIERKLHPETNHFYLLLVGQNRVGALIWENRYAIAIFAIRNHEWE